MMKYRRFNRVINNCNSCVNSIMNKWYDDWEAKYIASGEKYKLPFPTLDIEELIKVYDDQNTDSVIDAIKDRIYCNYHNYKWAIDKIYTSIIHMKYFTTPDNADIGLIFELVKYIIWLIEEKKHNKYFDYYVLKASRNIYYELIFDRYSDIENLDVEEECKIEHLTDLQYHLENFLKWCPDDPEMVEAYELLKDYKL